MKETLRRNVAIYELWQDDQPPEWCFFWDASIWNIEIQIPEFVFSSIAQGQVIKMVGALAEEIKETSLPLSTRPEDTISGFAVEEDSNRSEQQATFNHMNSGQRNVAALNFLSGQKQRNEPDPDEEEDFADNMVVVTAEEGYYGTKAEEPIGQV